MNRYAPPSVVPWPRVDGQKVPTCGYIEEALELPIEGWCGKGFYTRNPTELRQVIEQIDWRRVRDTNAQFSVRMGRGEMCFTDSPVYFVTEKRYQRLFRYCFKDIPVTKWQTEIEIAKRGRSKRCVSGRL